jgi:hypothetical protein
MHTSKFTRRSMNGFLKYVSVTWLNGKITNVECNLSSFNDSVYIIWIHFCRFKEKMLIENQSSKRIDISHKAQVNYLKANRTWIQIQSIFIEVVFFMPFWHAIWSSLNSSLVPYVKCLCVCCFGFQSTLKEIF